MYAYGHNTEIKLNNSVSIWKLTEENALGQPVKATTGTLVRTYGYTAFGMPTGRTAGSIQNFSYAFDVQKGNLLSRKDNRQNKTETFGYDHLNRLSSNLCFYRAAVVFYCFVGIKNLRWSCPPPSFGDKAPRTVVSPRGRGFGGNQLNPSISPFTMSIRLACGSAGSPGIRIISPAIATINSEP